MRRVRRSTRGGNRVTATTVQLISEAMRQATEIGNPPDDIDLPLYREERAVWYERQLEAAIALARMSEWNGPLLRECAGPPSDDDALVARHFLIAAAMVAEKRSTPIDVWIPYAARGALTHH